MISRLNPRRSTHRMYIRSSISAQSCDSVPPAPGWMVMMAFLAIVLAAEHLLDLAGLDLLVERVEARREFGVHRLARLGPFDEHAEVVALLLERENEIAILLERRRRCWTFCASAWSFQKSGAAARTSRRVSSSSGRVGLKDSSADRQRAC